VQMPGEGRWRDAHDYIASTVFDLVSLAGITGTMELRGIFSMAVPAMGLGRCTGRGRQPSLVARRCSAMRRCGLCVGRVCWRVWMVVRFVCVIRVPLCARVSRLRPVRPGPVSFYRYDITLARDRPRFSPHSKRAELKSEGLSLF